MTSKGKTVVVLELNVIPTLQSFEVAAKEEEEAGKLHLCLLKHEKLAAVAVTEQLLGVWVLLFELAEMASWLGEHSNTQDGFENGLKEELG